MKSEKLLLFWCVLLPLQSWAQAVKDSAFAMEEVVIKMYPSDQPLFHSPSSISIIDKNVLKTQLPYSLVPSFNTIPGVRMEERSPGSYRLSIRGSLLRSPFGIRNIKVYIDELLFTDAGGNTYLNSLDPASISTVEIIKGPEGNIFGANTGGVVLINPGIQYADTSKFIAGISAGSYGLVQQNLNWHKKFKKYRLDIFQGYQRGNGYREHSAMRRYFFQTKHTLDYARGKQLRVYAMYSDLHYETPGGLTLSQFETNPRMARPTGALPGAVEQKAGVYNKNLFGGITNEMKLSERWKHVISVAGNYTDFKNPFITNYETRKEKSISTRTSLKWSSSNHSSVYWNWYVGMEWQKTSSGIDNFGNNKGNKDSIQASDHLRATQYFFFTRLTMDVTKKLRVEVALSNNHYRYTYRNEFPLKESEWHKKKFNPQYMPKIALSYAIQEKLITRACVSRGFSPPTIAEVRPSDNLLYTNLQAETGWNYEVGFRLRSKTGRSWFDFVAFHYQLDNAIVRRTHDNGAEYFINAGKTQQNGVEGQIVIQLLKGRTDKFFQAIELRRTFMLYHFRFKEYQAGDKNYSGNKLTGVPNLVYVTGLMTSFRHFWIFIQYNYTTKIPLNDANTAYAKHYNLVQAKINYTFLIHKNYKMHLFIGGDNLLNEKYSLGNDLNAVGGRYYNVAPARNYYAGLSFEI